MLRSRIGISFFPAVLLTLTPLLSAFRCDPPPPVCPAIYAPACGTDGHTYGNDCEARAAGVAIAHEGACEIRCETDSDCGPMQECSSDHCLGACPEDSPCPDLVCERTCVDRPSCGGAVCPSGWHCEAVDCGPVPYADPPTDCGSGEACVPDPGSCRTDTDCPSGEHCELAELMSDPTIVYTGTCEPNYGCPPIDCAIIECPYGMAHDAAGCSLCMCAPPPTCSSDADCLSGQICESIGCMCPPGAECLVACAGSCVWLTE